jgi:hypothetical protein
LPAARSTGASTVISWRTVAARACVVELSHRARPLGETLEHRLSLDEVQERVRR